MSWIAIADHEGHRFNPAGLGRKRSDKDAAIGSADTPTPLLKGSIMIETRLSPDGQPQQLLAYQHVHPWRSSFTLQAIPGGGISVIVTHGDQVFHTALGHDSAGGRTDVLRITYSWDIENGTGQLAIERPETDRVFLVAFENPQPLMLEDIRAMTLNVRMREINRDVSYFAISNDVEPVGPMPSLTAGVPVAAAQGYCPAGSLKPGDLVHTISGGLVPVLQVVRRTVPAKGSFQPVRLRAPYFGLARDIIVAPQQRMVIGGSEVEYLFGQESVLIPAQHLINGVSAIACEGPALISYCQVLLPNHEAILAAGCPLESLYIGRIRRRPDHLATSLLSGSARNMLPEHVKSAYPVLKPFEAITLANQRAA